jgi:hypothetical protein
MTKTLDPFESLECCLAFDSRDWTVDRNDRWIYGIVFGWNECEDDLHDNHNMSWDEIARLEKLHKNFIEAKRLYYKSIDKEFID